jgi:response regulator RpfG family c-di-GMP phosphodiesterase
MSKKEAFDEIKRYSGTQFDPSIVLKIVSRQDDF